MVYPQMNFRILRSTDTPFVFIQAKEIYLNLYRDRTEVLVGNQRDAQFLIWYIYLNSLHVSSNPVLILRGQLY